MLHAGVLTTRVGGPRRIDLLICSADRVRDSSASDLRAASGPGRTAQPSVGVWRHGASSSSDSPRRRLSQQLYGLSLRPPSFSSSADVIIRKSQDALRRERRPPCSITRRIVSIVTIGCRLSATISRGNMSDNERNSRAHGLWHSECGRRCK